MDDTPLWICFCDHDIDQCADCDRIMEGLNAVRVRYNEKVPITITNEIMDYDLPSTGGPGIYPLMLVSVVFIITPLVYFSILRRKRERRGDG